MLEGLVVVEVTQRTAVSLTGSLLAELGADVVVLEERAGDHASGGVGRARALAGKRSLLRPADPGLAEAMLRHADVVLTSSDDRSAGVDRRPGQVVCDITAFGAQGPLAGLAASDRVVQALTGVAWVNGSPTEPPRPSRIPVLEMETAVFAGSGVLAALLVRERTCTGQHVEVAMYDVAVNALGAFLPLPFSGGTAMRAGNRHPILSPWNTYAAQDGWVMICAPSEEQWRRLCRAIGTVDLTEDPRFATSAARLAHQDEVDALVGAWTAAVTQAECLDVLAVHGIPCGPILEPDQLASEPNLRHRGTVDHVGDPVTGAGVSWVRSPVRHRSGPPTVPLPHGDADWARAVVAAAPACAVELEHLAGPVLHGLRVVEIGMNTVAPLVGRQLGALGADVIKVEPPSGDVNRVNAPLRPDGGAYIFAISNTDKRGIVLDLRQAEDAARLRTLLASADVLLENLKPGSLDRLGFSADEVRRLNPRLVYCSMSGFGHDSIYPGRPALDTVIQAMSGVMAAERQADMPTKIGISLADQLGGQFGLLAVLAALVHRGATGTTHPLDVAMHDATAWTTQTVRDGTGAPNGRVVEVADGYVVVDGVADAELARRLDVLPERLAAALRATSRDVLTAAAGTSGGRVDVAAIRTVEEALAAPHTVARRLIVERPTVDGDTWQVMESPLRLGRTPARVLQAMPRLGVLDLPLAAELGLLQGVTK